MFPSRSISIFWSIISLVLITLLSFSFAPPIESMSQNPDNNLSVKESTQSYKLSRLPNGLPQLVFGAGSFSGQYNPLSTILNTSEPLESVRLALQYGINAFDTSVYYGPSEIVLGDILQRLQELGEVKREDYIIMTKCGRFGVADFDYSPARIRASVEQSLSRLHTTYLDVVYLHDVEFISPSPSPSPPQDDIVLGAYRTLLDMQHEGKIRNVGISGYPLPILLRLSVYLKEQTGKPLNYILSYSHLTLQSSLFLEYIPKFREEGGVENVLCASPFSMGLLSGPARPPPGWHPAPPALREAVKKAEQVIEEEGREMSEVALRYTIGQCVERGVPLLVGLSTPDEVHASVRNFRDVQEEKKHEGDAKAVERAKEVIREAGYLNWSWPSPPE